MKNGRTKGEVETAIRNAVIKFEQEFMGRGPMDVKAFILRDLILVRLKGVLTPAERQLAKSNDGVEMVKAMRQNPHYPRPGKTLYPNERNHGSDGIGSVHGH